MAIAGLKAFDNARYQTYVYSFQEEYSRRDRLEVILDVILQREQPAPPPPCYIDKYKIIHCGDLHSPEEFIERYASLEGDFEREKRWIFGPWRSGRPLSIQDLDDPLFKQLPPEEQYKGRWEVFQHLMKTDPLFRQLPTEERRKLLFPTPVERPPISINQRNVFVTEAWKDGYSDFEIAKFIIEKFKVSYEEKTRYDTKQLVFGVTLAFLAGAVTFVVMSSIYKTTLYVVYGHTRGEKSWF